MVTQGPSPSFPTTESAPRWKYDVFLSFRGEDVRNNFISHLYNEMHCWQAIQTFKDDTELQPGEILSREILAAIEQSHLAIVVLSKNYASSTWCLNELVKILDCMESEGNRILPVFFNVNPCDVRHQTGSFGEAFEKHEKRFDKLVLKRWRAALSKLSDIIGWDFPKKDVTEAALIKAIVKDVRSKVRPRITYTGLKDKLIGFNSKLEELILALALHENDVRIIGIWGMGGIGKTTLAEKVHERISHNFQFSKILSYVKEGSAKQGTLVDLHKQPLIAFLMENIAHALSGKREDSAFIMQYFSEKKVLLIVDNVDDHTQMKMVVDYIHLFGGGSRIIVTARDLHLFDQHKIKNIIKLNVLNNNEALQLFSQHAFKKDEPEESFKQLSECFVDHAKGLPLALKVLGCYLCGRGQEAWSSTLDKLKKIPNSEVFDTLRPSYDGLDDMEKRILHDVAFFYKGMEKMRVIEKLDSCKLSGHIGIDILVEKSFLTLRKCDFSNKEVVDMHDLIQAMVIEIVRLKSPEELGQRTNLCVPEDIFLVLRRNTGIDGIRGIRLCLSEQEGANSSWNCASFSKMYNLTYLEIHNLVTPSGNQSFPERLSILIWSRYPSRFLPINYIPQFLTELTMQDSNLVRLWDGNNLNLPSLKRIDLSDSQNLTQTPNVTGIPNLEVLELARCTNLVKIHTSITVHKKLRILNFTGCQRIKSFPNMIKMDSLEHLILGNCSNSDKCPAFLRGVKYLLRLDLSGTGVKEMDESIKHLVWQLVKSFLGTCRSLITFSRLSKVSALMSHRRLWVSGSSRLESVSPLLPEILGQGEEEGYSVGLVDNVMKVLLLKGTSLVVRNIDLGLRRLFGSTSRQLLELVLTSLGDLKILVSLDLSDNSLRQGDLPDNIDKLLPSLKKLLLNGNNFENLPESIGSMTKLERIELKRCGSLKNLPNLPSSLIYVFVDDCASLKLSSEQTKLDCSRFSSFNSFGLVDDGGWNTAIFPVLRSYLGNYPPVDENLPNFEIVSPGSRITKWFNIQREGDTLTVDAPNFRESTWTGLAVSVVFEYQQQNSAAHDSDGIGIRCSQGESFYPTFKLSRRRQALNTSHIWVFIISRDLIKNTRNGPIKLSFDALYESWYTNPTRSVYTPCSVVVKRCGARLVDEQARLDLSAMNKEYLRSGGITLQIDEGRQGRSQI